VIRAVRSAGLGFDRARGTGVVLHMLSGLSIDGRLGPTAIGNDAEEADRLKEATEHALSTAVETSR
jgi:pheganomycin biosynthesis PGM1-like protein